MSNFYLSPEDIERSDGIPRSIVKCWRAWYDRSSTEVPLGELQKEDVTAICRALCDIDPVGQGGADYDFRFLFTLVRRLMSNEEYDGSLDRYFDVVMCFREAILSLQFHEEERDQVDWHDEDDVWLKFWVANKKAIYPAEMDAFSFALAQLAERGTSVSLDSRVTKNLTPTTVSRLEQIIGVALILQERQGEKAIFLPTAMVGKYIAKSTGRKGRAAASTLLSILREHEILLCTNAKYSSSGRAKEHKVNPKAADLYTVRDSSHLRVEGG